MTSTPADWGLPYEDVTFRSLVDHIPLSGWYLPPRAGQPVIILVHGLFRSRRELLDQAVFLNRQGYGALLFDLRKHGQSGGAVVTLGFREQEDVRAAVRYVAARVLDDQAIVLLGISMGAVAATLAAVKEPRVRGLISDGSFLSLQETVRQHLRVFFPLMDIPYRYYVQYLIAFFGDFRLADLDLTTVLPHLQRCSVLFITGEADQRIPLHVTETLSRYAGDNSRGIVVIPDARHGKTFEQNPAMYQEHLIRFLSSLPI